MAEVGASSVGDSVALEAAPGFIGDRSFDESCIDQGIEMAAHVARLVAQPQSRQKISASHLDIVEQGEDRGPMVVRVSSLVTW